MIIKKDVTKGKSGRKSVQKECPSSTPSDSQVLIVSSYSIVSISEFLSPGSRRYRGEINELPHFLSSRIREFKYISNGEIEYNSSL